MNDKTLGLTFIFILAIFGTVALFVWLAGEIRSDIHDGRLQEGSEECRDGETVYINRDGVSGRFCLHPSQSMVVIPGTGSFCMCPREGVSR